MDLFPILKVLKKNLNGIKNFTSTDYYADHGNNPTQLDFYLKDYRNNLFETMNQTHFYEYSSGNGHEMDQTDSPAKMGALRSSSALTFNLLGNGPVQVKSNWYGLPSGTYSVQFEKKLITLKRAHLAPATLDACLISEDGSTAIFCEMKMMEYLQSKSEPKMDPSKAETETNPYLDFERYFDSECIGVFGGLFSRKENTETPKHYDEKQMLKHTLGIYNAMFAKIDEINNPLRGKYSEFMGVKNIKLINCVWEIEDNSSNRNSYPDYFKILDKMHREMNYFMNQLDPIKQLFWQRFGINLEVLYLTHKQFSELISMTPERKSYLERYSI